MLARLVNPSLRVLTWCCVILLAVLSLLPAQQMVRTWLPGRLEHFVAYAGSAAIAMAGYGVRRPSVQYREFHRLWPRSPESLVERPL
jgi:hypothetical protein